MVESMTAEHVDDGTVLEWETRIGEVEQQIAKLTEERDHLAYKIELTRRLNDARAELVKTMTAKPGEPGYVPTKYDF